MLLEELCQPCFGDLWGAGQGALRIDSELGRSLCSCEVLSSSMLHSGHEFIGKLLHTSFREKCHIGIPVWKELLKKQARM